MDWTFLAALFCWLGAVAVLVFQWTCVRRVRRFFSEDKNGTSAVLEPVSFVHFKPMKAGRPLRCDLVGGWLVLMEKVDVVILGVPAAELSIWREESVKWSHVCELRIVACELGLPGSVPNPKAEKLRQMTPHARDGVWLFTDSEAIPDRDWLLALRRAVALHPGRVITSLYRIQTAKKFYAEWTSLLPWVRLVPGVVLLERYKKMNLTLGAAFTANRPLLESLGTWEKLGVYLNEDYQFGKAASQLGGEPILLNRFLSLDADSPGIRDWLRTLRRGATTLRCGNGLGFFLSILSEPAAWALGSMLFQTLAGGGVLLLFLGLRAWIIQDCAAAAGRRAGLWDCGIAGILSGVEWTLAWLPGWKRVWWSGRVFEVEKDGRIKAGSFPKPSAATPSADQ